MTTTSRPTVPDGSRAEVGRRTWQPGIGGAALVGLISVGLAIGLAELLSALGVWLGLLTTGSSPTNALGSTFIYFTPEWLKHLAIQQFGQHDKDALRIGMYLTLAIVALLVGLVARRSPRIAAIATVVLVLVTIGAVYFTSGTIAFDALPIIAGGAAGLYLLITAFRRTIEPGSLTAATVRDPGSAPVADTRLEPAGQPVPAAQDWYDSKPGSSGADHPMALASGGKVLNNNAHHGKGPGSKVRGSNAGGSAVDRRQFFRLAALGAAVAVVAGAVSRWIPSTAQVTASRAKAVVPVPAEKLKIPENTDFNINGLSPYVTPNSTFYRIDTAFVPPNLTAEDWRLRIHGLVDHPITIDYKQLLERPQIERAITLTCVSNEVGGGYVGNATWVGARLDALLKEAGPQAGADAVLCTSVDSMTISAPLEALTDGRDAMLAVAMNGEVLPVPHGFPVRMVVPGLYGYVSATKWVVDLEVTKFSEISAYWTSRGWSDHGPIKTASRIDVPKGVSHFAPGPVAIAGVAWAQHRGVKSVEVQIDDGPWVQAELSGELSKDTWRQWKYAWKATSGTHSVRCRATDLTGNVQDATPRDVIPDGATGYDSRTVIIT